MHDKEVILSDYLSYTQGYFNSSNVDENIESKLLTKEWKWIKEWLQPLQNYEHVVRVHQFLLLASYIG